MSFHSIRITLPKIMKHWILKLTQEIQMNILTNYEPRFSSKELKKIENNYIRNKVSNDFMELKNSYGFKLFHLTITWNQTHQEENPRLLNKDLNSLYRLYLVKYATNLNRMSKNNRHIQPIFVSIIDEGQDKNKSIIGNCKKLHHHCLIAAKNKVAMRLISLCGTNTIKGMCHDLDSLYSKNKSNNFKIYNAICSTDLKEITNDEVQTRYPTKTLYKFDQEFMIKFNYPIDFDNICSPTSEVVSDC